MATRHTSFTKSVTGIITGPFVGPDFSINWLSGEAVSQTILSALPHSPALLYRRKKPASLFHHEYSAAGLRSLGRTVGLSSCCSCFCSCSRSLPCLLQILVVSIADLALMELFHVSVSGTFLKCFTLNCCGSFCFQHERVQFFSRLFATPCAEISTTLLQQITVFDTLVGCAECQYKVRNPSVNINDVLNFRMYYI